MFALAVLLTEFCTVEDEFQAFWLRVLDQAVESYTVREVFNMESSVRVEAIENLGLSLMSNMEIEAYQYFTDILQHLSHTKCFINVCQQNLGPNGSFFLSFKFLNIHVNVAEIHLFSVDMDVKFTLSMRLNNKVTF